MAYIGILVFLLVGFIASNNKKQIQWRTVLGGLTLSFIIMLVMMKTSSGQWVFQQIGNFVLALIHCGNKGSEFIFGELAKNDKIGFIFAFQVMPNIIFFTVLVGLGYHFKIIPFVIKYSGFVLSRTLKVSGVQGINAVANSINGMIEGCLVVKKYVPKMNGSEIHGMMAIGLATMSSELTPALASLGIDITLLLTCSVASVPAALAMANLIYPNPNPIALDKVEIDHSEEKKSVLEVIIKSSEEGLIIVFNILATLLVFVAIIYMIDGVFAWASGLFGYSMNLAILFGHIFQPLAYLIGVDAKDTMNVGTLLGKKIIFNEFVAYLDLIQMKSSMTLKSIQISTFMLCSFSNIAACGISLGGYNKIAPRKEYSKYIARALFSAVLTSLIVSAMASLVL